MNDCWWIKDWREGKRPIAGTGQFNGSTNEMIKFLGQMLKLPVAAFVASMEIIAHALRDLQKTFDQNIEAMANMTAEAFSVSPPQEVPQVAVSGERSISEDVQMPDQDLSGNDLKYVSYTIVFTKRDYEATLESQKHQIVNYSTDGGSYGGIKIAHFMGRVAKGLVERPTVWKENNYPPDAVDDRHWQIPEEDEQYITFLFEVEQRLPRETADYDRRQVRVLEEIRDKI